MSDISTIRTLIADPVQYGKHEVIADGKSKEYLVPNSPVVPNSQTVYIDGDDQTEGTDYTFDDDLGLVVFATKPEESKTILVTFRFSILSDEQIQSLLDLNGGDVQLAAADACESIATSEALIQKKLKMLDFQTDGPALLEALLKRAKSLRDTALGEGENEFEIAEQIPTGDGAAFFEKILKDRMRSGI